MFQRGATPFKSIPYLINKHKPNGLYEALISHQNKYQKIIDKSHVKPIPGNGGESYLHYCLLTDNDFDFSSFDSVMNTCFKAQNLPYKATFHNDKRLLIDTGKGYYFHFYYDNTTGVNVGAKEIAANYKGTKDKSEIEKVTVQLQFWGDADPDMDFFNEHIHILAYLAKLPNMEIYSCDVNTFFDAI